MFFKKNISIDDMIDKAFTSSDLATGGLLQPEQAAKFVQGVFDKSVVLPLARRVPMKANKKQIDKITYGSDILQKPPSVGTAPSTTSKPTTSKVTLDAQETLIAIDIGYDSLEDSIEGDNLFDTILEITNEEAAFELDKLILHGDTAGGTGDYLEILDGLFKQISSHTSNAANATLTETVLFNGLKQLPGKYLNNEEQWVFFFSHLARLDYINNLAGKSVDSAFKQYLIQNTGPIAYNGVQVAKVGAITTENIGSGTATVNGSKGLLIRPKNIVFGVHRDINMEFQRQPRKRIVEVTVTMRVDVKLEEEDAVVKFTNVKHST